MYFLSTKLTKNENKYATRYGIWRYKSYFTWYTQK